MNTIYSPFKLLVVLLTIVCLSGCKKYIEESNLGGRTVDTYYNTAQGFEDLVKSNYSPLRPILSFGGMHWLGTDIFSVGDPNAVNDLNTYGSNLNSNNLDIDTYWKELYYSIGLTNTTLLYATKVSGLDAAVLSKRVAEAKALRALDYFLLVETFGGVPIVTVPNTEPKFGYTRATEQEVYELIISDLTAAAGVLPATSDFGRVTKGMAQHLLAKVYLTRGYKSYGGGQADFSKAAQLAETVMTSGTYALAGNFATLFDPTVANFQVNSEIIFSVQYSTTSASNSYSIITAPSTLIVGNGLHNNFMMDMAVYPQIGRSSLYNKSTALVAPTPYFFSLFDKTRDSRYSATVYNTINAQVATGGFSVGDTVIYFPDVAFTAAQKAAKKYYVYNPDEYRKATAFSVRSYPSFKKFRELNLAFGDNLGVRDTYLFRLSETYLIAAEAYLQTGDQAKALTYINAIRSRAGKTGTNPLTGITYKEEMKLTALTIDNILDERARELAGEELRWLELKRTGKLQSRVLLYNDEAKAAARFDAHFLLRPVPQSQIDLNRAEFPQNAGY